MWAQSRTTHILWGKQRSLQSAQFWLLGDLLSSDSRQLTFDVGNDVSILQQTFGPDTMNRGKNYLKKQLQDWTISHAYYKGSFSTELCYAQFNKARIL